MITILTNNSLLFTSHCVLLRPVCISLPDPAVWVLSDARTIWEVDVLLPISELNGLHPILFDPLDGAIWEYTLLLSVCEDALDGPIGEYNLLGAVREVLLDLVVCELEHLQAV